MSIKPESIDAAAGSGGIVVSLWNFVLGGGFNTILGTIIGFMSIAVLVQRWRINRRALRDDKAPEK